MHPPASAVPLPSAPRLVLLLSGPCLQEKLQELNGTSTRCTVCATRASISLPASPGAASELQRIDLQDGLHSIADAQLLFGGSGSATEEQQAHVLSVEDSRGGGPVFEGREAAAPLRPQNGPVCRCDLVSWQGVAEGCWGVAYLLACMCCRLHTSSAS